MKLDVESLRVFAEVVRQNGFTAAAEVLGMTQPAVSQKLQRLEQRLGIKLLRRDGHAVSLTAHGRDLLTYALEIVDAHDRAVMHLRRSELEGSIRLGCNEEIAARGLSDVIGNFKRAYPDVNITIRVHDSAYVSEWLDADEIDLALIQVIDTPGALRATDEIWRRDELVALQGRAADFDDIDPVPFISFGPRCLYTPRFTEQARSAGRSVFHAMDCPSIHGVQQAIEAGIGVGVLNTPNVTAAMRRWSGVELDLPGVAFVLRGRLQPDDDEIVEALRHHLSRALRHPQRRAYRKSP